MMHQVPRTRLTAPAVAGQLERGVRPHLAGSRKGALPRTRDCAVLNVASCHCGRSRNTPTAAATMLTSMNEIPARCSARSLRNAAAKTASRPMVARNMATPKNERLACRAAKTRNSAPMTPKSTRSLERGFVRVSRSDIGLDQGLAWLSRACAIKQEQFCVQECSVRHYACSVRPNVRVKPPA